MGWKGTLRSINAEANRQAKIAQKRQARATATNVVAQQDNIFERLVSLHETCNANMNWDKIHREPAPIEPLTVAHRSNVIQKKIDNFRPNFLDKTLKLTGWRKKKLDKSLHIAQEEDRKEYEDLFNNYQEEKNNWNKRQALANRLKAGDGKVYIDIIKEYGELSAIPLGKDLRFMVSDKNELAFDLKVASQAEIIPDEEYSLRQSGTLSTKKMAKTKGADIYQDHVCSCLLRVCREVFGLLPISTVQANALLNALNSQTGHLEDQIIISALIKRETMEAINFKGIDPSDSLNNFIHNMRFTKSRGFETVQRLSPL